MYNNIMYNYIGLHYHLYVIPTVSNHFFKQILEYLKLSVDNFKFHLPTQILKMYIIKSLIRPTFNNHRHVMKFFHAFTIDFSIVL